MKKGPDDKQFCAVDATRLQLFLNLEAPLNYVHKKVTVSSKFSTFLLNINLKSPNSVTNLKN